MKVIASVIIGLCMVLPSIGAASEFKGKFMVRLGTPQKNMPRVFSDIKTSATLVLSEVFSSDEILVTLRVPSQKGCDRAELSLVATFFEDRTYSLEDTRLPRGQRRVGFLSDINRNERVVVLGTRVPPVEVKSLTSPGETCVVKFDFAGGTFK